MCVIAYAPAGATIDNETILTMFDNNPDGAGLMWKPLEGGKIQIRKGFMNEYELIDAYNEIPIECEKAIHCRIATSGAINAATCHPFPVRSTVKAMRKSKDQTSMALMHNGIISYCTPKDGMLAKHSDTMEFTQDYLFPLRRQLDKKSVKKLIEQSTNSRLLIFRQNQDTVMLGNWIEDNGVYYSNDTYLYSLWKGYGCYRGYSCTNSAFWDDDGMVGTPRATLLSIEIPFTDNSADLDDAQDRIFNELDNKGFVVVDMRLDEYARSYYLEVEIEGKVPDDLRTVAGYEITENLY